MKLLYSNLLSAMAMAAANAQDNPPDPDGSCPAAAKNQYCGAGTVIYSNNNNDVDAPTTLQDCYKYARDNKHKSFQMIYAATYTTCKTPYTGYVIDADGGCSYFNGWSTFPYYEGVHAQDYNVIQDPTLWPDGYSCYENGSLKKYGDYCPAASTPNQCGDGQVYNVNAISNNPSSTVQDCYEYALQNGRKWFMTIPTGGQTDTEPGINCYANTDDSANIIKADGTCDLDWSNKYAGFKTYIVQDFSRWPNGYSCYEEDGSLKRYLAPTTAPTSAPTTSAPTPAPTSAPTTSAPTTSAPTPPTTGCPAGEDNVNLWKSGSVMCTQGWVDCTPICCNLQTHLACGTTCIPKTKRLCHTYYDWSLWKNVEWCLDLPNICGGFQKRMVQKEKAGFIRLRATK